MSMAAPNLLRSFTFAICMVTYFQPSQAYDTEEVAELRATAGRDARLPCGQEKVFLDGPDAYVAWLKDDHHFMYRFPNDDTSTKDGGGGVELYYGEPEPCERRPGAAGGAGGAWDAWGACAERTALALRAVSAADAGVYSCRVHYQSSPSVDYVINVRVVELPGWPKIFDEDGDEIEKGYIGAMSLGSNMKLTCKVDNADNETVLYWLRNGAAVSDSRPTAHRPLTIEYSIQNITRDELDAHYECVAQNSDVSEPLTAMVAVKMYLPPTSVEIRLNDNFDFAAGQPRVVDCVVVGCVPPPTITWRLGNTILKANTHKEHRDGNFTVSSLSVTPSLHDHGAELTCSAHNPYLRDQNYMDSVTMNVGYKPVCLTTREEVVGVVEKVAETVTCSVEAVPEPFQFIWSFGNTRTVFTSAKRIPGHQHRYSSSLTFLPTEDDLGALECRATNTFGTQSRACAYRLARGGAPEAPTCVLLRAYPHAARIQCKKGFDGGRPQTIHMLVVTESGEVAMNRSNSMGHFHLQEIDDQKNLTVLVFASSTRGRSPTVTLQSHAIAPINTEVIGDPAAEIKNKWLIVVVQISLSVVILVAIAGAIGARRAKRRAPLAQDDTPPELNPDIIPRSDGSFHREPDFTRDERSLASTTTITVNQLATCRNEYKATSQPPRARYSPWVAHARSADSVRGGSPKPARAHCGGTETSLSDVSPAQHSFYV